MPNTREKLIELCEKALNYDGTGREMRFTGGDVTPCLISNGVRIADEVSAVAYNLSPTDKWISVTERLPQEKGELCPWNYTNIGIGCKKPNEELCPLSNISTKKKPQTNADRIRAMSDEELARHLNCIGWDCHLCAEYRRLDNEPLLRDQRCDENCFEHCLEWLKQPAEGE